MSALDFPRTIASVDELSFVKKTKNLWKSGLFYLPATCATVKLFHNFIFLLMKPWLNFIKVWSMMNSRRFYAKISRKSKTNAFFGIFVSAQTAQICVCQRHRSMVWCARGAKREPSLPKVHFLQPKLHPQTKNLALLAFLKNFAVF